MGKFFRQLPMLFALLPLVAVILLSRYTDFPFRLLQDTEVDFMDTTRIFRLVVQDYPSERKKTWRYTVQVLPSKANAYLYIRKDSLRSLPTMGDTLLVKTTFRQGGQLGKFDYGRYLRYQGIVGQGYVRKQWRIEHSHISSWRDRLSPVRWRQNLYNRYQTFGLCGQSLATAAALTLGYREDLDDDQKRSFRKAGAAHVLAVSGLHTGIVYFVLILFLTCFGRFKPLYEDRIHQYLLSTILLIGLWAYAAVTGFTPSVVRCAVMLSLVELARCWHRQPYTLNIVLAAAFFILCFRPRDLFSVSFQLSFAGVISLITLTPLFQKVLGGSPERKEWGNLLVYIRDLIAMSFAAQIGTLPITLYYFAETSNYFWLTNLVIIPLAWILVICCVGLLLLGGIPYVGDGICWLTDCVSRLFNGYVSWVEHLPMATTSVSVSWQTMLLLYGVIILFGVILHRIMERA